MKKKKNRPITQKDKQNTQTLLNVFAIARENGASMFHMNIVYS